MTKIKKISSGILAFIFAIQLAPASLAATSTPAKFSYTGSLVDESGAPATGSYAFRFSLWSSADYATTDATTLNAINPAAANYSGYVEEQTITPNADGSFFAEVGAIQPLPNLNMAEHGYLQVEVKPAGAADTDYLLLDPDQDINSALDRKPLNSSPFAINSDTIDNTDIGTTEGQLATLGVGGTWTVSQMANGTNADVFTLNADNSAGDVSLQFGGTLNKTISYDTTGGKFVVNDGLFIDDNLAVSGDVFIDGLLNGRDINADLAALDQSIADVAVLTTTATALEESLAAATAELTAIDTALAAADAANLAEINAAQAAIASLTTEIATTNAALAQTQTDLTSATSTLTNTLATLQAEQAAADAALATDIATNAAAIATIEAVLAELAATQANIETTLATNAAAITALTESTTASIDALQAQIDGLTADVATTNAALDATAADTAASLTLLSDALTTVQADLNTLGTTVTAKDSALEADIAGINTLLAALQADITTLNSADSSFETDIATNIAAIGALETALTDINAVVSALQTDTTAINTAIGTLKTEITNTQASIATLETEMTAHAAAIGALETATGSNATAIAALEVTAHAANTDTGTTNETFTLDSDDTGTAISLQFGSTLAKSIVYDTTTARFEINDGLFIDDSLAVSGSIYVDGLVDGRDIAADGARLDALSAQIATLTSSVSAIAENTVSTFNWSYIPKIDGRIRSGDIGQLGDQVMTRAGTIKSLSISGSGKKFDGTYYVTKNSGSRFDAATVMTELNVQNSPTITTTPAVGTAGLSFAAGDVIRLYHSKDDQKSVRATLEIIYN